VSGADQERITDLEATLHEVRVRLVILRMCLDRRAARSKKPDAPHNQLGEIIGSIDARLQNGARSEYLDRMRRVALGLQQRVNDLEDGLRRAIECIEWDGRPDPPAICTSLRALLTTNGNQE
jgi:hypothetical protein